MKILRRLAFACAFAACSCAFADEAQPALYSFADLYRLAVGATPEALVSVPLASAPLAAPQQIRVATATSDSFVAEPRFTVTQASATRGWMLLLAGLAAASWVAHRRLTSAY